MLLQPSIYSKFSLIFTADWTKCLDTTTGIKNNSNSNHLLTEKKASNNNNTKSTINTESKSKLQSELICKGCMDKNETSKIPISIKQKLRQDLLKNYDKIPHPVDDPDETVEVQLGMALIHVDMDEKKSLITVDSWMRMAWKDSKLSWNPKDYKEFNGSMHFDSDELWKPDVLLYNK